SKSEIGARARARAPARPVNTYTLVRPDMDQKLPQLASTRARSLTPALRPRLSSRPPARIGPTFIRRSRERDPAMDPSLELSHLKKTYGDVEAVKDVSLSVPPGMIYGLLGPNGAGKTTTIRMVMDIVAPDTGEIRFFGRPRRPEDLQRIGYLPEERGLYRKMTVADQLTFLGELHGLKRADAARRSAVWLERLDLAAWAKKKVEELSKGMQ